MTFPMKYRTGQCSLGNHPLCSWTTCSCECHQPAEPAQDVLPDLVRVSPRALIGGSQNAIERDGCCPVCGQAGLCPHAAERSRRGPTNGERRRAIQAHLDAQRAKREALAVDTAEPRADGKPQRICGDCELGDHDSCAIESTSFVCPCPCPPTTTVDTTLWPGFFQRAAERKLRKAMHAKSGEPALVVMAAEVGRIVVEQLLELAEELAEQEQYTSLPVVDRARLIDPTYTEQHWDSTKEARR